MSYRQRSEWIEDAKMRVLQNTRRTDEAARELIFLYDEAAYNVEKEINALFARFAKDNALTDAQASQLLSGREYSTWRKSIEKYMAEASGAAKDSKAMLELNTLATTIGSVIAAAAPIIAGLVQGIGTVVSALAPVFQVIFDGIGQKVGSVLEFLGSKMGWIQNIIGTVAPVVADILTTAWGVISPVMDLAISVFKLLFNVVQTVFNGIASVVSSVWSKVKPIVEGIGNGLSWVAGKVSGLFGGGGGKNGGVGSNAEGTNNWRGGPTWVGERGPELVDLPKGSRVLPNKESVQLAQNAAQPVVREFFQSTTVEKPSIYTAGDNSTSVLERIEKGLGVVTGLLSRDGRRGQDKDTSGKPPKRPDNGPDFPPPPDPGPKAPKPTAAAQTPLQVTVAKLADQIIVREDADIDRIGEAVAKRVVQAARNMAPA